MGNIQYCPIVLEFVRAKKLAVGCQCPTNELLAFAEARGWGLEDVVDAIIDASAKGWIMSVEGYIHLTKSGLAAAYAANSNSR